MERECSALGGLFQTVIGDMKGSYPVWDDFISKASKLQSQLRMTVVAVATFLDAFQKVADLATSSRGGTRDIGSALTRMCMRHRSIEAKLRQFSMVFLDCLINPLQEQMEEWKRVANTLDKDHSKEFKKARQEIKKRNSDTLKLQKKAKKADVFGRGDLQPQLDVAMQDVSERCHLLEEAEKQALRKALVEERSRFCCFASLLRPVVEEEMSMLGEISHLQTLTDDLHTLTLDPHKLPASSEQVIVDLKGSDCTWCYQTPPSSPSTTTSRKSSMCSLNSVNSSDSRSSGSHGHSPSAHFRFRASSSSSWSCSAPPLQAPPRLSSVSSHDSGFISQDAGTSKSPSPMPPDGSQSSSGFDHHAAPCLQEGVLQDLHPPYVTSSSSSSTSIPTISTTFSSSSSSSPMWPWSCFGSAHSGDFLPSSRVPSWKDWTRPGPYDQALLVNTVKRSRDPSGHQQGGDMAHSQGEDPRLLRGSHSMTSHKEEREAHEELARVLARGLQLDIHGSSRDSVQGSSGYSSQTTTPCCSEDAIPTHDCDFYSVVVDQDVEAFDRCSSTLPRSAEQGPSHRRLFPSKRPSSSSSTSSSSSSISTPGPAPSISTPGVATIRRTPSSKPLLLRRPPGPGLGPIPIRTPVIPVRTPTVPELPGLSSRAVPQEGGSTPRTPPSPGWGAWPSGEGAGLDPPTPPPPQQQQQQQQHGGRSKCEWERQSLPHALPLPLPELQEEVELGEVDDFLVAIRRGVRLRKAETDDRSAPLIH
ncbi:protein MTSS 1-like isoform X2 [Nelusetta ayraudi]|uniref:protein MTSS 1-like isoform X2 n=1 Tax=Nelusetta ayraudi TaxID=303726 RepID=UPI003F7080C9